MTTRKLRRILKNYYREQGGLRPKPREVVVHSVPGIAFDITVVAVCIALGLACVF